MAKIRNMIGLRFGKLIVIGPCESRNGRIFWKCRCECGIECWRPNSGLKRNETRSCGCSRSTLINMIGKQYGTFTVVRKGNKINGRQHWITICSKCNIKKSIEGSAIRRLTGTKCFQCINKRLLQPNGKKLCGRCNKALKKDKFFRNNHHSDKLASWCKNCVISRAKTYKRNIAREICESAKKRAKDKKLSFDIDQFFIKELNKKQGGRCIYTGTELNWNSDDKAVDKNMAAPIYRASLDRIDSSKGYTKDNVQLVAFIVNYMKNALSESEFLTICNGIVKKAKKDGKL